MFGPLYAPQPLRVISTDGLRDRIDNHRLRNPPAVAHKTLATVGEFTRWGGSVRPAHILHLLGEALTPTLPAGEFEAADRWALYRYCWAFAPAVPGQPLRLSQAAHQLVDHHRTLAAEQLGIGTALRVGMWLVGQRHPGAIVDYADADVAVDRGSVDLAGSRVLGRVPESRRMRPDYFLTATDATGTISVYALEAKGTHTPGHYVQQMKKGASQVAAITVNGNAPTGYVVSTELSAAAIVVRVLDPEDEPSAWSGPAADSAQATAEEGALIAWSEEGGRMVSDPARLRRVVVDTARASLLAFAGQYATAAQRLPAAEEQPRDPVSLPDAPTVTIENSLGRFTVIEAELPLGERRVVIRAGLDAQALAALRAGDEARYAQRRQQLRAELSIDEPASESSDAAGSASTEADAWAVELNEDQRAIRSLRAAGSYLEVAAR